MTKQTENEHKMIVIHNWVVFILAMLIGMSLMIIGITIVKQIPIIDIDSLSFEPTPTNFILMLGGLIWIIVGIITMFWIFSKYIVNWAVEA